MTKNFKTPAEDAEREKHIDSACEYMVLVMKDAELRGMSGADVATSLAGIVAARNATLAGKCLIALRNAILRNPVTKLVEATPQEKAALDSVSTHGPAN